MSKNIHNIKVFGVGGGGCNAVNYMGAEELEAVTFMGANTDIQTLNIQNSIEIKIQLGEDTTRGLGAGAKPEVGRKAAEESLQKIKDSLVETDLLFIVSGMGGGTGTGAAPIVAKVAKELGILTVAVVTKPFSFEGKVRASNALSGIDELKNHVDSYLIIPNDKLAEHFQEKINLYSAFDKVNHVLLEAVQGISEIITKPGIINIDFNDLKTIISESGKCMMGVGFGSGEIRAEEATKNAIRSPLLEHSDIQGAKSLIVNVASSSKDLSLDEFNIIGELIREKASPEANIIIGTTIDESLEDSIKITIVASSFSEKEEPIVVEEKDPDFMDIRDFKNLSTLAMRKNDMPKFENVKPKGNILNKETVDSEPKKHYNTTLKEGQNDLTSPIAPKTEDSLEMAKPESRSTIEQETPKEEHNLLSQVNVPSFIKRKEK